MDLASRVGVAELVADGARRAERLVFGVALPFANEPVPGITGNVTELQMFNTIVTTPDQKTVIMPNAKVTSDNITNYTKTEIIRIDMVFGIGYSDDLLKAKELLLEILQSDERVLEDPAPSVAVSELADSSVNFAVRPFVKTADYWGVYFDTTERVKIRFDEEGISIPFPQQDLHLVEANIPAFRAEKISINGG